MKGSKLGQILRADKIGFRRLGDHIYMLPNPGDEITGLPTPVVLTSVSDRLCHVPDKQYSSYIDMDSTAALR